MQVTRRKVLFSTAAAGAAVTLGGFDLTALAAEGEKELRLPLARPAGNLDPQRYVGVFAVQDMIFDPLVGYKRGGKLVPGWPSPGSSPTTARRSPSSCGRRA